MTIPISLGNAERAAAEGVVAEALRVTFRALRADGQGGAVVDRQRGITPAQERVILAAGAAWDGDTVPDDDAPRAGEAAKFILADPARHARVQRLAAWLISHGEVRLSGFRQPAGSL